MSAAVRAARPGSEVGAKLGSKLTPAIFGTAPRSSVFSAAEAAEKAVSAKFLLYRSSTMTRRLVMVILLAGY